MANAPDGAVEANRPDIALQDRSRRSKDDLIAQKLHTAQEILAEVFGISTVEAAEMIRQHSWQEILLEERPATDE
jgi:hypothetical protein